MLAVASGFIMFVLLYLRVAHLLSICPSLHLSVCLSVHLSSSLLIAFLKICTLDFPDFLHVTGNLYSTKADRVCFWEDLV